MIRIGMLAEVTQGETILVQWGSVRTGLYTRQKVKIVAQHSNNDQFDEEGQKLYLVEWEVRGLACDENYKSVPVMLSAWVRGHRLETEF